LFVSCIIHILYTGCAKIKKNNSGAKRFIVLDTALAKATDTPRGIRWTLTDRLEDLAYAHDICLLAHTFNDIRTKLQRLQHETVKVGFKINHLTPNDPYSGRTAPLTSKRCILYIYSTNTGTDYFKHGIYAPFFLFKMQFVS